LNSVNPERSAPGSLPITGILEFDSDSVRDEEGERTQRYLRDMAM